MALFHNYFYTPGMILILLLYDYDQNHAIKDILIPILIGMGMATILWLPTGYLILSNHKSVVQTNLFDLLIPNFTLKGLVYDSYGCGLTVISWIALFQGIQFEKTRKLFDSVDFNVCFPDIFLYIEWNFICTHKNIGAMFTTHSYDSCPLATGKKVE